MKKITHTLLMKHIFIITIITILVISKCLYSKGKNPNNHKGETVHFTVTVLDKKDSSPLQLVNVILEQNNILIKGAVTNPAGLAAFKDVEIGTYEIIAHYLGYNDYVDTITIDREHTRYKIEMSENSIELGAIVITGKKVPQISTSINDVTGRQVYEGETFHAAPTAQMTTIIQQNLAGAVKASTGEIHIRGQHGEYSFLIDGVMIPLGVFGGLNEIVDPKIVSRITFYTGGFPAEYGGQISGLMDIQTRVPTGRFHLDISSFLGSYFTSGNNTNLGAKVGRFKALNSNGQSLSLSNRSGNFGYFFSASREETDRRIDQPVPELFHDHGFDYFVFGKIDYLIDENNYITADLNFSKTQTQVPFDSTEGYQPDDQITYNAFQILSYNHTISSEPDHESSLFIGASAREGGLRYIPNVNDSNPSYYNNDSTQAYQIDQNRTFTTLGIRTKYDNRLSHKFEYAVGFDYSNTRGNEDFRFFNLSGNGPSVMSAFTGYDFGAFAQSEIHATEWTKLDLGLRYDVHNAPIIPNQYQLSPRAKLSFLIDQFNTISVSYDRIFMPTNIENLGAVASQIGNNASPTFPEKDNLYEIDYIRNWKNGFNSKLSVFHKDSNPGLDDETLGSSTIKVNVNINEVKVSGIEMALTYNDPTNPFSAYLNSSLIHAYGIGPVSGGFVPSDSSTVPFDLDHDQRLSAVIGLNYQPANWFMNLTGTYGSGLSNGNANYTFKTGLFDFNQGAHTTPAWIFNISGGYIFNIGDDQTLEPSIYITNIFDHEYLIKGAFFSGASFEAHRNIILKLSYHL
jgi:outer membrane receptor for ferrienterochelin and colicin